MRGVFVILTSFIIAIFLAIMPLPTWAVWFRPVWVPLVLLYWVMALPHRVNLGVAFSLGLVLDVLEGTLLGEHAFALTVMVYLATKIYRQFRVFPPAQQVLSIVLLLLVYQFFLFWIQGMAGHPISSWLFCLPLLTSGLLWPWLATVLRDSKRRFRLH
jgi:rod shape-determining protein MreD